MLHLTAFRGVPSSSTCPFVDGLAPPFKFILCLLSLQIQSLHIPHEAAVCQLSSARPCDLMTLFHFCFLMLKDQCSTDTTLLNVLQRRHLQFLMMIQQILTPNLPCLEELSPSSWASCLLKAMDVLTTSQSKTQHHLGFN